MKLYTEEQVIKMIEKSRETGLTAEFLILATTPIELPSDKEINDSKFSSNAPIQELYNDGWEEGAKWIRNKIQGGEQ